MEFEKDLKNFRAIDGTYHSSMEEVEAVNNEYWNYKNPMIIDKDSELFRMPLSQAVYDRIVASPNYRCLIDILEEKILEEKAKYQQLDESNLKGMKR